MVGEIILALVVLFLGWFFTAGKGAKNKRGRANAAVSKPQAATATPATGVKIKVKKWSGDDSVPLPIKALTRSQWDCLSDGIDGSRIVAVLPMDMYTPRPDGSSGHGSKTIKSLVKHGFLAENPDGGYVITDQGLRACETLNVKF